jgi:serine/threonine-protein kinase RsbW
VRPSGVRVSALAFSGDTGGLAEVRRWVDAFLTAADVSRACIDDAVLVVSELASNAVRHGAGDVVCEIAMFDSARCFLSVVDFGGGVPGIVERDHVDVGGLGLVIVQRLAVEWGVATFDGGKAVFAVIAADPADVAPSDGLEPADGAV